MRRSRLTTCETFAAALGRPVRSLRRLRHRPDWPVDVPRDPPWTAADVQTVAAWSTTLGPRIDATLRDERRRLVHARLVLLRLRNRIASRKLVPRSVVERRGLAAIARTRAALLSLPRHCAAELVGRTEAGDIEAILAARVALIVDDFADVL